ncbi:E3 ubiquitin-protein ligase At3g02290 [Linum perenne]
MGAVCCCLHLEDCEDYVNPNSSVYRNCMCLSCFLQYFLHVRDGLVSRREKGSSHSHEEAEPLRSDNDDDDSEYYSTGDKWKASACEEGSKEQRPRSSLKLSSAKSSSGIGYIYSSSEDEEVCPTCLEEYTPENPKIMTKCAHHFHLGCIYEWMERSDSCPVCGKVTFNLLILFLCVV